MGAVVVSDGMGAEVVLGAEDATTLFALVDDFDAATISSCPDCRSRVLAALAVADVIDAAAAHPYSTALLELADDAATSHVYLIDADASCRHARWRDPGAEEWRDAVIEAPRRRPRR